MESMTMDRMMKERMKMHMMMFHKMMMMVKERMEDCNLGHKKKFKVNKYRK